MSQTTELVDSHCHLDRLDLTNSGFADLQAVVEDASSHGVGQMLCVSVNLSEWQTMMDAIESLENVYASVGHHPCDVQAGDPDVALMKTYGAHPRVVAVGETGLDYYHKESLPEYQHTAFVAHMDVAQSLGYPLIIHTRDAREDTMTLMKAHQARDIGGVMHCFTETWEMAKEALDMGFYISFSGIITFKNAQELRDVVEKVPLDRMLIETDAPYLAPVPYRGKSNFPSYVRFVAEHVAAIKGVAVSQVAQQTTTNFRQLFFPHGSEK